jgi:hypothetical protein
MLSFSKQARGGALLFSPERDKTLKGIHGAAIFFADLSD